MAFATVEQLAQRLGRTFTEAETTQATALLGLAQLAIAAACDKDDTWADELDPVPAALQITCIEIAVRIMSNPSGARSRSERLGQYEVSESFHANFDPAAAGITLTDREELRCRRAVYGSASGSVRVKSVTQDLLLDRVPFAWWFDEA
jgi:predicted pyridoxine 5'-phosphate oxidase superfamily flavin-nucleotide-binding protein